MNNDIKGKVNNVAVIIPAYEPDEKLIRLVEELDGAGVTRMVIVDDGSGDGSRTVFDGLVGYPSCHVIRHAVNLGKGRALKSAFNYCLTMWDDIAGSVTADSDGQHGAEDIIRCMEAVAGDPSALILGARNFSGSDVPLKSMLGNRITSLVFRIALGLKISDTQTGLRGIGREFMRELLGVAGERYEFETNMLIETKSRSVVIKELPIQTIYINENETSHFRPFRDSVRIYALILKYILSSCISSVIDIGLFTLFCRMLRGSTAGFNYIFAATAMARVISAVCNYFINLRVVFASKASVRSSFYKYALLAAAQLCLSALLVRLIYPHVGGLETWIKLPVDITLFFVNYVVQREYIFKS